jgi:hypothetical protein
MLGFGQARINCIAAWARMYTIVAVAMQKRRAELSPMRAMVELIRKERSCRDMLDHRLKLNLSAVL